MHRRNIPSLLPVAAALLLLARRRFSRATRMHRLARRDERRAVAAIEQVLGPG